MWPLRVQSNRNEFTHFDSTTGPTCRMRNVSEAFPLPSLLPLAQVSKPPIKTTVAKVRSPKSHVQCSVPSVQCPGHPAVVASASAEMKIELIFI